MPSCIHEIRVLCLRDVLVAYLGIEVLYCLKVMVASCWLCHFGSRSAIGLPWGFLVAF